MEELAKRIEVLLAESEQLDKMGLENASMEKLEEAAKLESDLLRMRKEQAA